MLNAVPVPQKDTSFSSAVSDVDGIRELGASEIDDVSGGIGLAGAAVGALGGLASSVFSGASLQTTVWNTAVGAAFGFVGAGPGLSVGAARCFAAGGSVVMAEFFME